MFLQRAQQQVWISTLCIVFLTLVSCHTFRHITGTPQQAYRSTASDNSDDNRRPDVVTSTPLTNTRKNKLRRKYADLMHVPESSIKNYKLYNVIDDWYGVPYHIGGDDMSGIDCSGWVKEIYTIVYKKDVPRTAATQYSVCQHTKKIRKLAEGDLVFFNVKGEKLSHVGVYLKNRYFVHASTSKGIMVSSLDDPYWQQYFYRAGKVK